jgi:hypothetical protein
VARLFILLGAAIVGVLVFFPNEVAMAVQTGRDMIAQMAVAAAGYYGR